MKTGKDRRNKNVATASLPRNARYLDSPEISHSPTPRTILATNSSILKSSPSPIPDMTQSLDEQRLSQQLNLSEFGSSSTLVTGSLAAHSTDRPPIAVFTEDQLSLVRFFHSLLIYLLLLVCLYFCLLTYYCKPLKSTLLPISLSCTFAIFLPRCRRRCRRHAGVNGEPLGSGAL